MTISAHQCRAARGLFAMTQQELANASGVSLRTISSFEGATDRVPTIANLGAIRSALERLGTVFTATGVDWAPVFSAPQIKVVRIMGARHGRSMLPVSAVYEATGCTRSDLEYLRELQVIEGIDALPMLSPIGLHILHLLNLHDADVARRESIRRSFYAPTSYTINPTDRTIHHPRTGATFRIVDGDRLALVSRTGLPVDETDEAMAGAREALRMDRERTISGQYVPQ